MVQPPKDDTGVDVVNAPQDVFGDLFHVLLRTRWPLTLAAIAGLMLSVDLVFGLVFLLTGGVANARPGSFADAFFFSVQTKGSIGYGAMYPASVAANLAVTAETIVGLIVAAIATGLVFFKFAIPRAKLEFAHQAVVFPLDGVPTLAIRMANTRGNLVVDAQVRVTLVRAETSREGLFLYKMYDLRLFRDRSQALGRSWQVLHALDENSPLRGMSEESVRGQDMEIDVLVTGLDGTSSQNIHGRHVYLPEDLRFGYRYVDMLRSKPDGRLELDFSKLHAIMPVR